MHNMLACYVLVNSQTFFAAVHALVGDGDIVKHNCIVVIKHHPKETYDGILKYILLVIYVITLTLICYFMFTWMWNSFS